MSMMSREAQRVNPFFLGGGNDTIYADAGLTPRYRALIDQHVERLKNSDSEGGGG